MYITALLQYNTSCVMMIATMILYEIHYAFDTLNFYVYITALLQYNTSCVMMITTLILYEIHYAIDKLKLNVYITALFQYNMLYHQLREDDRNHDTI